MRAYLAEVTKFILVFLLNLVILNTILLSTLTHPSTQALAIGNIICFFSILSIYMLARAVCDKPAIQKIINFTFFLLLKALLIITLFKGLRGKPDAFLFQSCLPFLSLITLVFTLLFIEKKKIRSLE
jgi:hypothetical protein